MNTARRSAKLRYSNCGLRVEVPAANFPCGAALTMILPKDPPHLFELNSYYVELEKLTRYLQKEIGL